MTVNFAQYGLRVFDVYQTRAAQAALVRRNLITTGLAGLGVVLYVISLEQVVIITSAAVESVAAAHVQPFLAENVHVINCDVATGVRVLADAAKTSADREMGSKFEKTVLGA